MIMYRITRVEGAASRTDGRRVEGIPCVRSGSGEDAEPEMSLNKKRAFHEWVLTRGRQQGDMKRLELTIGMI